MSNQEEDKLAAALRPFGWTCTEDFWDRYYRDPWVFNLANAVESLTESNQRMRDALVLIGAQSTLHNATSIAYWTLHPDDRAIDA